MEAAERVQTSTGGAAAPNAGRPETSKGRRKQYTLSIPQELDAELREIARKHETTIAAVIRAYLQLGRAASKLEDREDAALIFRIGDTDRQVMLVY